MAICMKQAGSHIHEWCSPPPSGSGPCSVGCDQAAMKKHGGRKTTQIGLRIPDEMARKIRPHASRHDSVNEYFLYLIRTQAIRVR